MLQSLSIRNLAIIDRLDLELGPGLNVLTGETGAGKSIILGALTLILGGRAGADMVRSGADRAIVDAVFDVSGSSEMTALLEEYGFEAEDGRLLLSREVGASGKSGARVGGRPSAVAQLKAIGEGLADLHGQHEHQSLLAAARHVDMLDAWGGKDVLALREDVAAAWKEMQLLEAERAALQTDSRERAHLIDLYTFQVGEIEAANPQPGEDDELAADARRLGNAQRLAEGAGAAMAVLSGEAAGGLLESLAPVARGLEDASRLDDRLEPIVAAINAARYELEEAARDLAHYVDSVEFNPERLEQVEERLETIRNLKRKYGATIPEVLAYWHETAAKLDALTHGEERGAELDGAIEQSVAKLRELCTRLTAARRRLAEAFGAAVSAELTDLAMERTRFEVEVAPCDPTAKGADRVEFVIAPNPGEPLRPLARIASGGEISRVMLAIKSAMSRRDPLPTMVFDEIDVGVGGRTAGVIADKLCALASAAQVLCITHLPQIASRGDRHFYIEKSLHGERTITTVTPLGPDERVEELARMLGGAGASDTVLRHAREMLQVR